jgi:hypothetical protein
VVPRASNLDRFLDPCTRSLNVKVLAVSPRDFEVLTAVVMKSTIFWDITPCSPLKDNRGALLATSFRAGFFPGLLFGPEDGGDMFLRNVG